MSSSTHAEFEANVVEAKEFVGQAFPKDETLDVLISDAETKLAINSVFDSSLCPKTEQAS